jgi:hypothetical protein
VRDDDHPYLAYSPKISIQDSSEPFRAFLGAILSVVKDVPVDPSAYSSDLELDTIEQDGDNDPFPKHGDSGEHRGSSDGSATTRKPATGSRVHDEYENTKSELIVRPFRGRYYRSACLFTHRLLHLPRIHLRISRYGFTLIACRTTRFSSHSALGAAKSASGLPDL